MLDEESATVPVGLFAASRWTLLALCDDLTNMNSKQYIRSNKSARIKQDEDGNESITIETINTVFFGSYHFPYYLKTKAYTDSPSLVSMIATTVPGGVERNRQMFQTEVGV